MTTKTTNQGNSETIFIYCSLEKILKKNTRKFEGSEYTASNKPVQFEKSTNQLNSLKESEIQHLIVKKTKVI